MLYNIPLIYNIPLDRLDEYAQQPLIIRTSDPVALVAALPNPQPERILEVQLLSLASDSEPLNAWAPGMPVELVMTDPAHEFASLYRHTDLLDRHPVRVIIPVVPDFSKAVKVAVALDFAVTLAMGQPEPALIDEAMAVLNFALYQTRVAQPIDYFHSVLLGLYHDHPLPLWRILDDDPSGLRYVSDTGAVLLPGRLAGVEAALPPTAPLEEWIEQHLATAESCLSCEFRLHCAGYFKWPQHDYDCTGVKRLFSQLRSAALELRRDLDAAPG